MFADVGVELVFRQSTPGEDCSAWTSGVGVCVRLSGERRRGAVLVSAVPEQSAKSTASGYGTGRSGSAVGGGELFTAAKSGGAEHALLRRGFDGGWSEFGRAGSAGCAAVSGAE